MSNKINDKFLVYDFNAKEFFGLRSLASIENITLIFTVSIKHFIETINKIQFNDNSIILTSEEVSQLKLQNNTSQL